MLLTDYFLSEPDITWDYAVCCGVSHGVIRLPEDDQFDITDKKHWDVVINRFRKHGIKPVIIEPLPNYLHEHIKTGDELRDESIEKVIRMLEQMDYYDIRTVCFNFMAHIGWLRTKTDIVERGGGLVSGFNMDDFKKLWEEGVYAHKKITEDELWANYEYFIKAIIPYAEKYNINLALHPDDPPVCRLGDVSRIMVNYENINKAIHVVNSDKLGITMCQSCYQIMGEDLKEIVPKLKDKIFFIHFRNTTGNSLSFRETFHDNGSIDMAEVLRLYKACGIDVPIRVDHVPTMAGEKEQTGYSAVGRLFAIGYLKGLLQAIENERGALLFDRTLVREE